MTDDSKAIWKAAIDHGWSPQRTQAWRVPEGLDVCERQVAIYGEPLFAEAVADQLGLVLLEPSIDWLVALPEEYRLRSVELLTLAEARCMSGAAFVKPADGKIFDPKVYASGTDLPTEAEVDADVPVLRAGVVDFRLEVRCFVADRKVITASPYWRNDALSQDEEGGWTFIEDEEDAALKFARSVLEDARVLFPPACTLDVGRLITGDWAVVEANPCWGAGFYGCDPTRVLGLISLAILPKSQIDETLRRWVSRRRW